MDTYTVIQRNEAGYVLLRHKVWGYPEDMHVYRNGLLIAAIVDFDEALEFFRNCY